MMNFRRIQDVIEFAIALEQASQTFYRRLAEQTQSVAVRHFLLQMVAEETMHEQQLRQMIAGGETMLSANIPLGDMDRYIDAMNVPEPLDYKGAVRIACDKENASRMLYTILSGQMERPELVAILNRLALQEQHHYEFFVREYRRLCVAQN